MRRGSTNQAPNAKSRTGGDSWRARHDFEIRLIATMLLTLVVIGALQYVLTARETKQRLLDEATYRAKADVVFVQQAFDSKDDNDARVTEMNARLAAIGKREGIRYVLLVDQYGVVTAASNPAKVGTFNGGPELRSVVESNRTRTDYVTEQGMRDIRYIVPVELPTGRFALEVEQDSAVMEQQLQHLRQYTFGVVGMGLGVGVILFYLLGGRSIASKHRRVQELSSRDGLTNLENHRSFQEALARTLALADRQNSSFSLVLIDLDDFKLVNDRLGHRKGDQVLAKLASLLETGRVSDVAYRIGGDEFALILPNTNSDAAWIVCERLWKRVVNELGGSSISIGIATSEPGISQADLSEHADVALYEAKKRGRNTLVSFEELGNTAVIPAEKVNAVRQILTDLQIGTAFQPIWDLQGQRPLGFEALARPPADYALQGPGEMFEIGEMIGRTQDLDVMAWRWALERAAGLPRDIFLFLNVSPFTADHGDEPIDRLCKVVEESSFEPSQIVVEFTEKWSGRRDLVIQQAERLRAAGFNLALDDVGAGAGDLEMMAKLPVQFIKIDLHVVQNARTDPTARGVLSAITAFASHSGSEVIAEGIEDQETLQFLQEVSESRPNRAAVRGAQGFFLGRPAEGPPIPTEAPYVPLVSDQSRLG